MLAIHLTLFILCTRCFHSQSRRAERTDVQIVQTGEENDGGLSDRCDEQQEQRHDHHIEYHHRRVHAEQCKFEKIFPVSFEVRNALNVANVNGQRLFIAN